MNTLKQPLDRREIADIDFAIVFGQSVDIEYKQAARVHYGFDFDEFGWPVEDSIEIDNIFLHFGDGQKARIDPKGLPLRKRIELKHEIYLIEQRKAEQRKILEETYRGGYTCVGEDCEIGV